MLPKCHRVHQGAPRRLRARLRGHIRHARQSARPTSRNLNMDALRPLREGPKLSTLTNLPQVARDPPSTCGRGVMRRAQQAKSLLAGLDLDTAIRLRWAMRDIRGKRTKLSPVSENDLAALIDLGFLEMREGLPRLTGLGLLALD